MENLEIFCDSFLSRQHYAPNTERLYRYRLMALSRYEGEAGQPIHTFSVEQMQDAFRHISATPVVWASLKNILSVYFIWLSERGINVEIGERSLSRLNVNHVSNTTNDGYFYKVEELLSKLKSDLEYVSKNDRVEEEDYRMVACALLLSWYGLSITEIVDFKKSYISTRNTAILVKGELQSIPNRVFDILYECSIAVGINKNTGYTTAFYRYEDSEFLMRTTDLNKMSKIKLSKVLCTFNERIPRNSDPYNFNKVYYSGVFSRAFIKEYHNGGEPNNLETIVEKQMYYEDLFGEKLPEGTLYKRIREYKEYKKRIK